MRHSASALSPSGCLGLALLALLALSAQAQQYQYNYPMIADPTGANCSTVPKEPFPKALGDLLFGAVAFVFAQGAAAFNVPSVCIDVTAQQIGYQCYENGCCNAACAQAFVSQFDNPDTMLCADLLVLRLCAYLTNKNYPPDTPVSALSALFYSIASLRKRCSNGRTYDCQAIPAGLFNLTSSSGPVNGTAPAQPPSSMQPAPSTTPSPSPAPTPTSQSDSSSSSNKTAVIAGVVGGVGGVALLGLVAWAVVYARKKKSTGQSLVPDDKGEPTAPTTGPTAPAPDSNQGGPDHTNNDNQPGDAHVSVVIASKTSKASHAPRGPSNQEAGRQEQITSRMTQQTESTAPYPTELPAGPSGGSSMQGSNSNTSQPVTATTITPQITQSTGKSAGSGRGSGSVVSRGRGSKQGSFGSHSVGRMSHGALSSLHESISGLSLDEELVYQRGALSRMQIPWSKLKIGQELGVGGFGAVYKGLWQGIPVAVKMIKSEAFSPSARAELRREALAMFEKPHPCVATIYGMVDEEEQCALVMRYYRNGSVAEVFRNAKYASVLPKTRLLFVLQVATGMDCLHERKLFHGDLKTANLLMADDFRSVVITDFGLAGMQGQAVSSGALTVHISPPEVLLDPKAPRDNPVDVYAFGIVMLELLTGRHCFPHMNKEAIRRAVIAGERPPIPEDIAPELASIITACWAQKAEDRPSFTDVLARLEPAIDAAIGLLGGGQGGGAAGAALDTTTADWTAGQWTAPTPKPRI